MAKTYIKPAIIVAEVELSGFIATSINVYGDAAENATGLARPMNITLWEEDETTNTPQQNNEDFDEFDDFEDEEL